MVRKENSFTTKFLSLYNFLLTSILVLNSYIHLNSRPDEIIALIFVCILPDEYIQIILY